MFRTYLLVGVAACGLLVWLFGPAMDGGQSFAYRDASHFYHPMFEWIRDQWAAGHWPWWVPHENLGVALVAENTSSIFYPGKLLFALPLDYTLLFNWYTLLHVVLAAWGAWRLARHFDASPVGAGLAALSYAFGAPVVMQYCNVIFLVGAAWLPWSLLWADRMLRGRSWGAAAAFGTVLALMATGGDPQMAYNAGLLATLYAVILWRTDRRAATSVSKVSSVSFPTPNPQSTTPSPWVYRPLLLAGAAAIGCSLAAVQVWPSIEGSPHSARASYDAPRTVYELAGSVLGAEQGDPRLAWYDGLLGRVYRGHQRHIYHFDVTPWSLVELVWPNVTGKRFPNDRRWLPVMGWDDNLWIPSLYLGLLPLSLALTAWTVRRAAPAPLRWASWMAVLGTLASWGAYGLAWFAALPIGGAELLDVGGEVGGLYWWMTVLLPGYVYFRFPGKLFIVASLGFSLLAARGWDAAWNSDRSVLYWLWWALIALSILGLVALPFGWPYLEAKIHPVNYDDLLGPFDEQGSYLDIVAALVHTLALAGVLLALLSWSRGGAGRTALAGAAAIVLTALDLAVAQKCLMIYAPAADWQTRPPLVDQLPPDLQNYRVYRQPIAVNPAWVFKPSTDRYIDYLQWHRATLAPKFELRYGVSGAEAAEAVIARDYAILLDLTRNRTARAAKGTIPAPEVLDLLAARVAIVAPHEVRDDMRPFDNPAPGMVAALRPTALPRASIVHQVKTLPELTSRSPYQIRQRTLEIFFPEEQLRDLRERAFVETNMPLDPSPAPRSEGNEACTIVVDEPTRVELEVQLASAGLLVLSDQFYPGWRATVESDGKTRDATILRTNRVMRGVALPAGRHRVLFDYQPRSIWGGAAISGATMLVLVGWSAAARFRRRERL